MNYKAPYVHGHYHKCSLRFQHKAFKFCGKTGNRSSPVSVTNNFQQHDIFKKLISLHQHGNVVALKIKKSVSIVPEHKITSF